MKSKINTRSIESRIKKMEPHGKVWTYIQEAPFKWIRAAWESLNVYTGGSIQVDKL